MESLDDMRNIIALSKAGNFLRAAEERGISISELWESIARQETAFGVDLFIPGGKPVELTEFGMRAVEAARVIVEEVEDAEEDLGLMRQSKVAQLVVGVDPAVEEVIMPDVFLKMVAVSDQLCFTTIICPWDKAEENLDARSIDIYVGHVSDQRSDKYDYRDLPVSPPVVWCKAQHPLVEMDLPTTAATQKYPQVGVDVPHWYTRILAGAQSSVSNDARDQRNLALNTQIVSLVRTLLLETDAIAILHPNHFVEDKSAGRIVSITPQDWPFRDPLPCTIVQSTDSSLPPAAAQLCASVEEVVTKMTSKCSV